jgi:predicted Na+-dependent transporter
MQNSALGAYLALAHFSDPLTAVPCAISACTHSLMGSAIAGFWRWRDLAGVQKTCEKTCCPCPTSYDC